MYNAERNSVKNDDNTWLDWDIPKLSELSPTQLVKMLHQAKNVIIQTQRGTFSRKD